MKPDWTELTVVSIAAAIGIGILKLFLFLATPTLPIPMQVVDKAERDGRCYVAVWVEVTPEEYIGLDRGDEYKEER